MTLSEEYLNLYDLSSDSLLFGPLLIESSLSISTPKEAHNAKLICAVRDKDGLKVDYITTYLSHSQNGLHQELELSIPIDAQAEGIKSVKVYIWNPFKEQIHINSLETALFYLSE